ncbi:MAG: J domain-containing protein [Patescibacteria group bacterium]
MAKNYYNVLGVEKGSSKEDIKRAFHRMAHKYHPDKKGGDSSKFKEVSEAYAVLSDEKKRAEYDAYGQTFQGGNAGGGFSGFNGFDFSNFSGQGFGNINTEDLGDIFGDFFGGGRERVNRGRDISIDLELSFDESIFGVERKVLISKLSTCEVCKGSGGKPGTTMEKCKMCNGNGKIRENRRSFFGSVSVTRQCDTCAGIGKTPKEKCNVCRGEKILKRQEEITIAVPPGIDHGEVIRLTQKGEASSNGVAGDLYVRIHVKKHQTLTRDGNNLITTISVKLTDALLGADYKVSTLEGPLTVSIPAGIAYGEVLRVKGRGVPYEKNHRGDLLIKVNIAIPQKISKESKKLLEDLRKEGM